MMAPEWAPVSSSVSPTPTTPGATCASCRLLPPGDDIEPALTFAPLTRQTSTAPVSLIHIRSLLASPAKLPTPFRCQLNPSRQLSFTVLATWPLLISQIVTWLVSSTNTISDVAPLEPEK